MVRPPAVAPGPFSPEHPAEGEGLVRENPTLIMFSADEAPAPNGVASESTLKKRVAPRARLLLAMLVIGVTIAPAEASARWRDVEPDLAGDEEAQVSAFDVRNGRVIVVSPDLTESHLTVSAYPAGRTTPKWTRNFARSPGQLPEWSYGAGAVVVVPRRNIFYVSGGFRHGQMGAGSVSSAGFVYAFDSRTGRRLWSHTDVLRPGAGGYYSHVAKGANGSVVAIRRKYIEGPDNYTDSYSPQAVAFGPSGRVRWRWTDEGRGITTEVASSGDRFIMVGDTYIEGWAKGHRIALDASTGKQTWRHLNLDHVEYYYSVAAGKRGQIYVAGEYRGNFTEEHVGYRAALHSVSSTTGRIRWTRRIGRPEHEQDYYFPHHVISTREGPCVTGGHVTQMPVIYDKVYPDDGFIGCYSTRGSLQWLDLDPGGQGHVLGAGRGRLFWIGRQETGGDLDGNRSEVVRFQIRSLADGTVLHSSRRERTVRTWSPTHPELAVRYGDSVHFLYVIPPTQNPDGTTRWRRIVDRIFN